MLVRLSDQNGQLLDERHVRVNAVAHDEGDTGILTIVAANGAIALGLTPDEIDRISAAAILAGLAGTLERIDG